MTKKYLTLPAVVAGALGMGSTIAWAAEPTTDELMKQIEALQAKVQQLETKQTQSTTAREVDATLDKVLKDAEKRSQMLQMEGFTAGWNDGFVIQSADGNYVLRPFFQFQTRYVVNYRDETPGSDGDDDSEDVQKGFEIPRMKIGAWGNVFTPELTYNFRWASGENNNRGDFTDTSSGSSSGNLVLENAFMQYYFNDDMAFRLGQWKDNWTHEETVESYNSLAVDRSLMNDMIGGGLTRYVQAVGLIYQPAESAWRAMATYQDGINTSNTNFLYHQGGSTPFSGPGVTISPNWGASGRFEYKINGDWKNYDSFTAHGEQEDLLVIGGGGNWTQDGSNNLFVATVDGQWKGGPLGVYAGVVGNFGNYDSVPGADDTFDWGFIIQGGYMLNEQWELFGRVDYTFFDDANLASGAEDVFGEWVLGVNYYWHGQRAKFTVDVGFLPDGVPSGSSFTNLGYLDSNEEFQFAVRGQFQLLL
jgi:hypothetical protein